MVLLSVLQEHPISYDVYLSYSERDHNLVQIVSELLSVQYPGIRIFSQHQSIDENKPWQEDVYEVSAIFPIYLCRNLTNSISRLNVLILHRNLVYRSNCKLLELSLVHTNTEHVNLVCALASAFIKFAAHYLEVVIWYLAFFPGYCHAYLSDRGKLALGLIYFN